LAATLIDGKRIAEGIRSQVASDAESLRKRGTPPSLAAILIGEDPSAASYAQSQAKRAADVGMEYRLVELPSSVSQKDALKSIADLNADRTVHGIMLHLPLPEQLDAFALQQAIVANKDVEGVGAANLGLLAMGRNALVPCTAAAAFACLESTGIEIKGREAVVVGRSVIVGKPLAMLLLAAHATVTQCHTRTKDLAAHTRRAEILAVAAGVPQIIGAEYVSAGATVIDVGTHRITTEDAEGKPAKKTVGDVRFDEVAPIAQAITPVPGGVGPVTVAMLLANTISACQRAVEAI
jgi:methylenetetrahydrofolate dehydrogenase (NADP+)/methenyltetrahydrofolate cyclohydrolase